MIQLRNITNTGYVEGRRIMNSTGTPTAYIVTEDGQIYSDELQGYRKLDEPNKRTGYIMISLAIDGKWKKYLVHRLVAQYFLSNEHDYPCVNHKDCNKLNNDYHNLEHCTYQYNSKYAMLYGNGGITRCKHGYFIFTEDDVHEICRRIERGDKLKDIAKDFDVKAGHIGNIKRRTCYTYISKDYDFGDDFVFDDNLTGNEGNNYIPPLEVEPKYVRWDDPENIHAICKMMADKHYKSNRIIAAKFGIQPKIIKAIRYHKLFPEISKQYDIKYNKSTVEIRHLDEYDSDEIDHIFDLLTDGEHTIASIAAELCIAPSTIKNLCNSDKYRYLRLKYDDINLKDNHKGHHLTPELINKVVTLIKTTKMTREQIADMANVSVSTVCKIKKKIKKGSFKK